MFDLVNPAMALEWLGQEEWDLGSDELGETGGISHAAL